MMPLLDKLREQYGVGPLCSELHIAPSTYYHCQQQRHHPDKRVTNGAIVIHTQRLKSDPGGNLLS
ncbi:TPA: hypothetical protein RPB89_005032 [Escherichia coli]|nr:hypothetical protein [Escherichia coli]EFJ5678630.1 hypothetical protein [Escherichia coli]QLD59104.1 hypothetical protein HLK60_25085 [Escherichia coli]HAI6045828.1 hypothetical protein [Escherichia coli]HAL1882421.1 hypothetical protein [Escherichia coli]